MEKSNNINNNKVFSQENRILHKSTFTSHIKNNIFNNYLEPKSSLSLKNKNKANILSISFKKHSNEIKISKRPKINSSFSKTFGKPKFNYDDIINFNFSSKKTAQLKCINTSTLTTNSLNSKNSSSFKNKKENTKEKKTSLFNKKNTNILNIYSKF